MKNFTYTCPAGHVTPDVQGDYSAGSIETPVELTCAHEDENGTRCGLPMAVVDSPINDLL